MSDSTLAPDRTFTVAAPDGALLRAFEYAEDPLVRPGSPTVVLAHGWTLTHASWLPVVERLVADGCRVVLYDQRGHGRSGRLRDRPTIRQLGADLATVVDVAVPEGDVVLGGHSMGGMTIMAYAGLFPERVAARVRGVVFVATSSGSLGIERRRAETVAMRALSRAPGVRAGRFITVRGQRRLLFGEAVDPEHVRLTRQQVAGTRLPTIGRFHGALSRHDEVEALAALAEVPTTVLVGDRDRLTPVRHSRRLAELLPQADLEVLPGCGHMLTYEATEAVARSVQGLCTGSHP